MYRGKFLDAGTGTHSLKWINTLDTEGFTAVTADPKFADTTRKEVCTSLRTFAPEKRYRMSVSAFLSFETRKEVPNRKRGTYLRTFTPENYVEEINKMIRQTPPGSRYMGGGGIKQREACLGMSSMGLDVVVAVV